MTKLNEIKALPNGSKFYRSDMHIHSFVASHDVKDSDMTPANIVQTAKEEGLDIISVTDHNEIHNVEETVKLAGNDLFVVPGVELSTPEGHLLCYLPDLDALQTFYRSLSITDNGKPTSRCQNSILHCLSELKEHGGFGVLAHVDAEKGYDFESTGNSPHKYDVICHEALLGIELKNSNSDISYSDVDPDPDRVNIGKERITRLGLGSKQYIARVLNSDSHSLKALGRNANGDKKVTRIRMQKPTFEALKIAMQTSDSRIRLEDDLPVSVPHVLGLAFDGGFLDCQSIHFSKNLNCIIGGRGTGKSTTFEAVRCLNANQGVGDVVDAEPWPSQLHLFWQDQVCQSHELKKSIREPIKNLTDPISGLTSFPLESFGQGETAKISKEARDNPLALLDYLDRFVEIGDARSEEYDARDKLLGLQSQIEEASAKVSQIPENERALASAKQQLAALEKADAEEVIKSQRQLASEKEIRNTIDRMLGEVASEISDFSTKEIIEELTALNDKGSLTFGDKEYSSIVKGAHKFQKTIELAHQSAKASFIDYQTDVDSHITSWKVKETAEATKIENKIKELEAQNIRLDMGYIKKLAVDEAKYTQNIKVLKGWKKHLSELRREYKKESNLRWKSREKIATIRDAYARDASSVLRSALTDLQVSLKFERSACSPDGEDQIISAMEWRTSRVPKAKLLIEKLSMPGLLKVIDDKNISKITSIRTDEGGVVFGKADAELLVARLSEPTIRFALERCDVFDIPKLTVTKKVTGTDGREKYVKRDFSKLSMGQQQSILLALVLSSKSNSPLIIDQPEDNLDSEFIYHSLVPVLRLAKERRQVIVVTHNANIAVLGDAEQIIVLKSTAERAAIVSRGSIDDSGTSKIACDILEGTREAFDRRAKIYGVT